MKNNAYVYLHKTPHNDEIFYVGIGVTKNFGRAFETSRRNVYHKNIVKKYGFYVEIVCQDLTRQEACKKEMELIALYGRRDLDTGILVNMTNGGDGVHKRIVSEESRKKMSFAKLGDKNYLYGKKAHPNTLLALKNNKSIRPRLKQIAPWFPIILYETGHTSR